VSRTSWRPTVAQLPRGQISPALGHAAVQRAACAHRFYRPASPPTLRGGGRAARDEHGLAGSAGGANG
jgi:hypothetical protein